MGNEEEITQKQDQVTHVGHELGMDINAHMNSTAFLKTLFKVSSQN